MKRIEVTSQLTVFQSAFEGWQMNAGLISTSDGGVVLIDPGILPEEIAAIKQAIADRPVHLLVNTHYHADHCYGLSAWPTVPRIASVHHKNWTWRASQVALSAQALTKRQGIKWEPAVEYLPPTLSVSERRPLHDSLPGWEIIPTPSHSPDSLALYDENTHTLWAGDAIRADSDLPVMHEDSSAIQTLDVLEQFMRLDITQLVPGHGAVWSSPEKIKTNIETRVTYLRDLHRRLEKALKSALPLEDMLQACTDMSLPYHSGNDAQQVHAYNARLMWYELGGTGCYDDIKAPLDSERRLSFRLYDIVQEALNAGRSIGQALSATTELPTVIGWDAKHHAHYTEMYSKFLWNELSESMSSPI